MLPSSLPQLVIVLLFVLPGFVQQIVRARPDGPRPDDLNQTFRVLRAIAGSALFGLLYLLLLGDWLTAAAEGSGPLLERPRLSAVLLALGVFGLPAATALLAHLWRTSADLDEAGRRIRKLDFSNYDPTPTAWDFAYRGMGRSFVRALTTDGRWIGGYFGGESYASSFPQPREFFLEHAFTMSKDGSFESVVHSSAGVYIRCDDVRVIEFLAADEGSEGGSKA